MRLCVFVWLGLYLVLLFYFNLYLIWYSVIYYYFVCIYLNLFFYQSISIIVAYKAISTLYIYLSMYVPGCLLFYLYSVPIYFHSSISLYLSIYLYSRLFLL